MSDFARRLGLSYTFTREMERGNRLPSDDVLVRIAHRLGVGVDELVLDAYVDRSPLLERCLSSLGAISVQRADDASSPPIETDGAMPRESPQVFVAHRRDERAISDAVAR